MPSGKQTTPYSLPWEVTMYPMDNTVGAAQQKGIVRYLQTRLIARGEQQYE
jgi:hypothetical protein